MIEQGVIDIYNSDNFQSYLKMLSKFHNYSLNNVILILSQHPTATLVAGYSSWRDNFHRQVNKGEKAIKILAPYQVNIKKLLDDVDKDGNTIQTEEVVKVTKFRVVNVFDINQTNGEPLADLDIVTDLKGTSNNARSLIAAINEVCSIPIEFKSENEVPEFSAGAKGYYSVTEDKIVVNKDLDDIQIAKTLAHEYAHSLLHKDTKKSQSQREIEAESLAFVICDHFDIDTSDYSFGYVASYAADNPDNLKAILSNIQTNAKEIINSLEPLFERNMKVFNIQDKYLSPVEMETMATGLINDLENDLKTIPGLTDKESIDYEINNLLGNYEDKHTEAVVLYDSNDYFKTSIIESLQERFNDTESNSRPFLENSLERSNYNKLEAMAKPILEDNAVYCKMTSSGRMDFNIERIIDEKIAISHYGKMNGDAMADPDIEFKVDIENKLLLPESYQNDYLATYISKNDGAAFCNDINYYTDTWLDNIKNAHYKISEIYTEDYGYSQKENPKELYKYCKENGIAKFAVNPNKEIER